MTCGTGRTRARSDSFFMVDPVCWRCGRQFAMTAEFGARRRGKKFMPVTPLYQTACC
jgi:hypothetical protein